MTEEQTTLRTMHPAFVNYPEVCFSESEVKNGIKLAAWHSYKNTFMKDHGIIYLGVAEELNLRDNFEYQYSLNSEQ